MCTLYKSMNVELIRNSGICQFQIFRGIFLYLNWREKNKNFFLLRTFLKTLLVLMSTLGWNWNWTETENWKVGLFKKLWLKFDFNTAVQSVAIKVFHHSLTCITVCLLRCPPSNLIDSLMCRQMCCMPVWTCKLS